MKGLNKIVRNEVRELIIANNGELKNKHISPIISRYKPFVGIGIVSIVQNACNYFRYSPTQATFRVKYNYK